MHNTYSISSSRVVRFSLLFFLVLAPLVLFLDKPFHIDDTLFIYTARQILRDPLRPFDFIVNWGGTPIPMWVETKNPPLVSYYIAPVIKAFGEDERILHLFFAPFAILGVAAFYFLAKRFSIEKKVSPFLATALFASTPAFLVSANTIMSDIPALSVYLAALALFVAGYERDRETLVIVAHFLIGVTTLMKYSGVLLMPIFFLFHVLKGRRPHRLLYFLIPLGIIFLWHWLSVTTHGTSHMALSSVFSVDARPKLIFWLEQLLSFLAFVSGCSLFILWMPPLFLRSFRNKYRALALCALAAVSTGLVTRYLYKYPWGQSASMSILSFGTITLGAFLFKRFLSLTRSMIQAPRNRFVDAHPESAPSGPEGQRAQELALDTKDEVFLYFWLFLTAAFVFFISWCMAARFVLLLYPAMSIICVNAMVQLRYFRTRTFALMCAFTYLASLLIANSDVSEARSYRTMISYVVDTLKLPKDKTFYCGTWGFKYYIEKGGYDKPIQLGVTRVHKGDFLVMQGMFTNYALAQKWLSGRRFYARNVLNELTLGSRDRTIDIKAVLVGSPDFPLNVLNGGAKAGFHSSNYGMLPFAFSRKARLYVAIWEVSG